MLQAHSRADVVAARRPGRLQGLHRVGAIRSAGPIAGPIAGPSRGRGSLVVRWEEVCGVARCVGHEVIGVLQVSTAGRWFVLAFSPTVRGGPMTQSANLPDV